MPIPPKPKTAVAWFEWFQKYVLPLAYREHIKDHGGGSQKSRIPTLSKVTLEEFNKAINNHSAVKKMLQDWEQRVKGVDKTTKPPRLDTDSNKSEDE